MAVVAMAWGGLQTTSAPHPAELGTGAPQGAGSYCAPQGRTRRVWLLLPSVWRTYVPQPWPR